MSNSHNINPAGHTSHRLLTVSGRILFTLLLLSLTRSAAAQPKRIYLADDDHTDYMWTADEATYRQAFVEMLDHAMARAEATTGAPAPFRHRFNADGHFWLWEYEHARTPEEFERLIRHVKAGDVGVPLNALVICYGGMPAEAVIRSMYYPGRLERRHGLRFPLVLAMEDQTLPGGLVSLWAGSGARYSWRGICDCASKIHATRREHEVYWWDGPDGQSVLMKWNSMLGANTGIGGYAEARDAQKSIDFVLSNADFKRLYPYEAVGVFGRGWDDLKTLKDDFPEIARRNSRGDVQVIVSNEVDFFQDLEKSAGPKLPHFSGSFGNEWDLLCASMGELTARVKRATEKLRSAEAMATWVALHDPKFMAGREALRDRAFNNMGLYFEHGWTGDGAIARDRRAAWQRRIAGEIEQYVHTLYADAASRLGTMVPNPDGRPLVLVFNPLGWDRLDMVDVPAASPGYRCVVDRSTGQAVEAQRLSDGRLRFIAAVPSLGYKVFELTNGSAKASPPLDAGASRLGNGVYSLRIGPRGGIEHLIDEENGHRDLAAELATAEINSGDAAKSTAEPVDVGPVSASLRVRFESQPPRTSLITMYGQGPRRRIDIVDEIDGSFADARTWDFAFNLKDFTTRHEEVGAVATVGRRKEGGFYADRNTRTDYLTMGHFVDLSEKNGFGVTLSNADSAFFQLGNSDVGTLDTSTPLVRAVVGMQVDGPRLGIPGQGGDKRFVNHYALRTHADRYSTPESMRFALEHQNPLVVIPVGRNASGPLDQPSAPLLHLAEAGTIIWSVKPAEEGISSGIIVRAWNLADSQGPAEIHLVADVAKSLTAMKATHIETDLEPAKVEGNILLDALPPQRMQTYRLQVGSGS